jgi:hypothetical protein
MVQRKGHTYNTENMSEEELAHLLEDERVIRVSGF